MHQAHVNDGVECLIEPEAIEEIKKTIIDFDPSICIELGTYYGGFTKYLAEWVVVPIWTFDNVYRMSEETSKYLKERDGVTLVLTPYLLRSDAFLVKILSSPHRKFMFVDNGNKQIEIELYAYQLQSGDLLGVHDWGTEVFRKDVERYLVDFDEHPINQVLRVPGKSITRFFIKK